MQFIKTNTVKVTTVIFEQAMIHKREILIIILFTDTNKDVVPDDLVAVFYKQTCNFGFATHLFGSELKALYSVETVPRGVSFRISPTSHSDLYVPPTSFTARILNFKIKNCQIWFLYKVNLE